MKKDIKVESGLTVGVDLGDRWSRYCVLGGNSTPLLTQRYPERDGPL